MYVNTFLLGSEMELLLIGWKQPFASELDPFDHARKTQHDQESYPLGHVHLIKPKRHNIFKRHNLLKSNLTHLDIL